jgi:RNA polymerase sigma-70 factor, ECF subfamily
VTPRELHERPVVEALRRGDEDAFRAVVTRHHTAMVRVAEAHVRDRCVAEEIAQDAWMCLLMGLDRFQGRSSLRTWLLRVVRNLAVDSALAERRSIPGGALGSDGDDAFEVATHPAAMGAGRWRSTPTQWQADGDRAAESADTVSAIRDAIEALPARQRAVIELHDVVGCPSTEVCDLLGLSAANQRVLLYRARERVRAALDVRFTDSNPMTATASR